MATRAGLGGAPAVWPRRLVLVSRWLLVVAGVIVAIGLVAPLRRGASDAASRLIFWIASPLAPSVRGFDELPQSTRVLAADGSELSRIDGTQGSQPVRLAALPDYVPRAVLAAEDADFYHHSGVNPAAMLRAAISTVRGHTEGGSTITQQLAKLDYAGSHRTVLRKVRELLYAVRLERSYTKDRLLEQYLNQVYFGNGAYGLGAASRTYFGVDASRLTIDQAATLAGKIHEPSALDPFRRPEAVVRRRNDVLAAMVRHRWLDRTELATDEAAPLRVQQFGVAPARLEKYFIDFVQQEALGLDALGGTPQTRRKRLFTGGYSIQTTFDPRAFDAAAVAAKTSLGRPGDPTTAVASVQPGDGAIHVLFGGLDVNRSFDVASQGQRQAGSAFKPFVYLAALRKGIDPRTRFPSSSPMTLTYQGQRFQVVNYEGAGGGPMTIDDALVQSVNTVYAQLGLVVGPANVVAAAQDAGIPSGIAAVPAVALGGLNRGVSPLEMAAAYATFAARGLYATPYSISRLVDRHGHVVYQHAVQTRQAFEPNQAGVLTAALERVVTNGTATAAAIGRPVAGKTGTTSGYTDAWFAGFVPQLATAVWVGNPDQSLPMADVHGERVTGGSFPARVFADMMREALATTPAEPLFTASPDSLVLHMDVPPGPSSRPPAPGGSDQATTTTTGPATTVGGVMPSTTASTAPSATTTPTSAPPGSSAPPTSQPTQTTQPTPPGG